MPHLLATISSHGLGHLSQSAPVLNALRRRLPQLQLTVASALPEVRLRQRIEGAFRIEARTLDVGFAMHDAFRIDMAASAGAYRALHADWPRRVDDTTAWLQTLQPTLLLCNAAYLPLVAAARRGIPAFGMSSLNWADLFEHLFGREAWAPPIHAQMLDAYRAATGFLKLTPGMDMPSLPRSTWVGPVAGLGRERRGELQARIGAAPRERVVLVAFGGLDARLPLQDWRFAEGLRWLVPAAWQFGHPRVTAIETLGWPFADLMASVDAVIGKPGYGTFAEAACHGTPVLYAPRPGWPEQEPLVRWLHAHGRALRVDGAMLRSGRLDAALAALWRLPAPPRVEPVGADEAAALLERAVKPSNRSPRR